MKLTDCNLTLGEIDLGTVDAESDRKLSQYFITTPQADAAVKLRKTQFLGRKGAGKSALFSQLEALFQKAGHYKSRIIQMTPDQYAWGALRQYKEVGLLAEQAHSNAWEFTIAVEVAGVFCSEPPALFSEGSQESLYRVKKFIEQNYGGKMPDARVTASRLLKGLESFNLDAFGFGIGFSRKAHEQPLTPQIVDLLFADLYTLSKDLGIVVALDRLDDSWDGSPDSKSLLIGLLKAAKTINDRFSIKDTVKGISCLIFLRADIYDGLQFDDKDKHRALEESLSGPPSCLKQ